MWHVDSLLLLLYSSGFHLSVIHNKPDILDKLLFIMSKEKTLKPVIDEQNKLYQVCMCIVSVLVVCALWQSSCVYSKSQCVFISL